MSFKPVHPRRWNVQSCCVRYRSEPGYRQSHALTLCREGFDIVVASPELENNELVAAEVRALGAQAMTLNLDVTSADSVRKVSPRQWPT